MIGCSIIMENMVVYHNTYILVDGILQPSLPVGDSYDIHA